MFRFAPYILKTLWRHRTRTVLTVSGSAVALFVFCFVAAIQEGLDGLTRQGETTLIVFQANKFCPATSNLPQDYDQKIAGMQGVREVVPIQVFTNNCRASLDVIVFYGTLVDRLRRMRDFQLVDGDWAEFENHQDAALVGSAVAQRRGLHAGERFTIGNVSVNVAGVFTSENRAEENYIYTHLEFLQRRHGKSSVGTVTQFEVFLDDNVDAVATSRAIDDRLRAGPVETDTRTKGVFQTKSLSDLTELIGLARYLGYACVGLMVTLLATTTIMAVGDRITEHAVLQTIGFSGPRIFGLVLSESVFISLAGGAIGVGIAMTVLSWSGLAIAAQAVTVAFVPSANLAATALVIALASGLLSGVVPAWHAARAEIVPALRQM